MEDISGQVEVILLVFFQELFLLISYSSCTPNLIALTREDLEASIFIPENKVCDKSRWLMCFQMDFQPLEIKWQRAGTPRELGKAFAAT